MTRDYPQADLLVTADWLAARLGKTGLHIVDLRQPIPQYRIGYPWGHIPGAIHLDLMQVFNGRVSGVPGSLGSPSEVAAVLSRAGLAPGEAVVVYDSDGGPAAAQAFWLLETLSFCDVILLDGGFAAWQAREHPVSTQVPVIDPVQLPGAPDTNRLATLDWILNHLDDPELALVDARSSAEYAGGHIPNAVLLPWDESLDASPIPCVRDANTLRARFEVAGVTRKKNVVTYCQTGARSAHIYFTLRLLDYPSVRNYDGSWQEWGDHPGTPKHL